MRKIISCILSIVLIFSCAFMSEHTISAESEDIQLENLALNTLGTGYPEVFASYTNAGDNLHHLVDGIISGNEGQPHDEGPRNRWTNYNQKGTAYIGSRFENEQKVHYIEIFAFNDFGGVPTPQSVSAEYWDGSQWKTVANETIQTETYSSNGKVVLFTIEFTPVMASEIRIALEPQNNASVGATEMRIWGERSILYGFTLRLTGEIPDSSLTDIDIILQDPEDKERTLYIKAIDVNGNDVTNGYTIPANTLEHHVQLDVSELDAGIITLIASWDEAFTESKTYTLKKRIASDIITNIYNEVKTPYEYGIILAHEGVGSGTFDSDLIDNPNVFMIPGDSEYIYMTYVGHDGTGYRTGLARSKDMLSWEKVGKILENGAPGSWDEFNAAGYIVRDHTWGEIPTAHIMKDGRYAMTYLASDVPGYEAGIKRAGVAFTDTIFDNEGNLVEWERHPDPVLDAYDGTYAYEKGIIWKLQAIWDPDNNRYTGFYNAASGPEVMCQVYSDDLINWTREESNPVITIETSPTGEVWGDSHNADADVVKIGDYWVMFYFTSSPGGIIDSFAVSPDLIDWSKSFIPLTTRNSTYSQTYAHKPCVVKKNGVVYHYYNAVGTAGRLLAVDTSIDLSPISFAQNDLKESDYTPDQWANIQARLKQAQNALTEENGSLEKIEKALLELRKAYNPNGTDYSKLAKVLEQAEEIMAEIDKYRPETVEGLAAAMETAWSIFNNSTVDQATVDAAAKALLDIVEKASLLPDKSNLHSLVSEAEKLKREDYTSESWDSFAKAMVNAQEILTDSTVSQDEVDLAYKILDTAMQALIEVDESEPHSESNEDTSDSDTSDSDTSDSDTSGQDTSDQDSSDKDTSDKDTSDKDTSDNDSSDKDSSDKDLLNGKNKNKVKTGDTTSMLFFILTIVSLLCVIIVHKHNKNFIN